MKGLSIVLLFIISAFLVREIVSNAEKSVIIQQMEHDMDSTNQYALDQAHINLIMINVMSEKEQIILQHDTDYINLCSKYN